MATAEQIKSLIRSHFDDESERFSTIALQVAAHEAKRGHNSLAFEIRDLIDSERNRTKNTIHFVPTGLDDLVLKEVVDIPRSALVMPSDLDKRIERIIHEYRQKNKLKAYGLKHRRKILLMGPPGTGKTMTAHVLAQELNLILYTIQMDRLVTKFMGESSAKLRQVFDLIQASQGVYLFDEFDAIGGKRSADNDVGEMRRILNAFLQFIDRDNSDSLIIAATNNPSLLDDALFRRYDDVLYYEVPQKEDRKNLIRNILGTFISSSFTWKQIIEESAGLSHAEIDYACRDAIKDVILSDTTKVTSARLLHSLKERQEIYKYIIN